MQVMTSDENLATLLKYLMSQGHPEIVPIEMSAPDSRAFMEEQAFAFGVSKCVMESAARLLSDGMSDEALAILREYLGLLNAAARVH